MDITYDYYRIFYYVGRYGSFTKAAQMLKNSQPNITRAMNNLESQLGVVLFRRSKRGIMLTPEGEKLYSRISLAFEQIQIAESEIEASRNNEAGIISIGVSDISMYEVLYPILPELKKNHPNLTIHISNESTLSAIRSLTEGTIDFAIVTTPVSNESFFVVEKIKEIREQAVVSSKYSEHIDCNMNIADISRYPLIMLAKGTATRQFYDQFFSEYGLEAIPQMTASNVNQVISMVKVGLGVGFIPESIIEMDNSFARLNLNVTIPPREICIVRDKGHILSQSEQLLIDYIKKKHII